MFNHNIVSTEYSLKINTSPVGLLKDIASQGEYRTPKLKYSVFVQMSNVVKTLKDMFYFVFAIGKAK